jgi:hypothetical protein
MTKAQFRALAGGSLVALFLLPDGAAARRPLGRSVRASAKATAAYEVVVLTAPAGLTETTAYGIAAGQAAGTGRIAGSATPDETHAVYWPAGNLEGIDLHPEGWRYSAALDTDGEHQVGSGNGPETAFLRHALLWSGAANS